MGLLRERMAHLEGLLEGLPEAINEAGAMDQVQSQNPRQAESLQNAGTNALG